MNKNRIAACALALIATTFTCAASARAQEGSSQNVTVTVRPSQTVEQKVADETREKELRKAAEEKLATAESARAAESSPRTLLKRARTFYVESNTSYFEPVQLQNELRKRDEFDAWGMAIVDGWGNRSVADVVVAIDRPLFTYTFTYKLTARDSGVLLATGKLTAFDSNAAAPKLAERIFEEIKQARGESKLKK